MKKAIITTSKGTLEIDLFLQDAPMSTKLLLKLFKRNKYKGVRFSEVIPGFITQTDSVTAPEAKRLSANPIEVGKLNRHHDKGTVSIYHHQNGSGRLFISHERNSTSHLDSRHTIIGRLTNGLELIETLGKDDYIQSVKVA